MTPEYKRRPASRQSVLIATTSIPFRAHARTLLAREPGFWLTAEADSGAAALELYFRFRPSIILVDVGLPDRSGFEVVQCLRQADPDCVLVLLSNFPDSVVLEAARTVGASAVCDKTKDLSHLRDLLCQLTGQHSKREPAADGQAGEPLDEPGSIRA